MPDPTLAQVTYMPKQLQNSQVKAPNNTLKFLGDLAWNTFGSPPPRTMQGGNWIHPTVGKRGILQNAQLLANNDLATIPRYIGGPTPSVQLLQGLLPYAQQYGPELLGQHNWAQLQGLLGV